VKAFVTGATGFVGSHLAALLASRGDEVTCLVRRPGHAAHLSRLGARIASGSLDEEAGLAAALGAARPEVVFHLAGATRAGGPKAFFAANEGGTRRLIEAMAAARIEVGRLVFVSSLAAVGPSQPNRPHDGEAEPRPLTAYGRSKLAAERAVRALPASRWVIVRPPAVYGPGDREFLRLFRLARRGVVPVMGRGDQKLSLIYAPDLADALVAAGTVGRAAGGTYYVAHDEVVRAADLALAVAAAVGRARVRLLRLRPSLVRPALWAWGRAAAAIGRPTLLTDEKLAELAAPAWTISNARAEGDLGWRPAHSLATGLERTAAWYRAEGWLA
jgi:nucleoside-diphosphate-sugar epimerase